MSEDIGGISLIGKRILITGASRGIGAAVALVVAKAGAEVIAHFGGHAAGAIENLKEISEDRKEFIQSDFSKPGSARELWAKATSGNKRVDVVINNAAINVETPFEGDLEQWDVGWSQTLQVNVLESSSLIKEAVNHFLSHSGGVLITMSSWSGQRGSALATLPAYAASKAAMKAVTQTVAQSYAKRNIQAYTIAPGIVKTRMSEQAAILRGGEENMKAALAMGELVPPQEIGELVAFLASGKARHLTGATFDINGASYIR
jgi:NAD(P)-dependent dehydrogenase (short-subunit alcohol dehydrogenase family)